MQRIPPARRPDDPLRQVLGPVFTVWENKYWVDELYWTVILNPYVALSRFLAEVVDWRFWHDWFHERVIKAGFDRTTTLLAVRVDQAPAGLPSSLEACGRGAGLLYGRCLYSARGLPGGRGSPAGGRERPTPETRM